MASKLLFYSNIYPSFQDNKYGCMQWSFIFEIDMQLFLLTPFLVILYRKIGIRFFSFGLAILFFLGIYQNYRVAKHYKLSAFVLALNDYYKYSQFQNKPWMKVSVYSLGVLSGVFFE